ncbi:unnamed protein product [Porites lobata]|uniref:Secreted protein n=1 Tax=Porites lobata TaxID=104759 RepID=A0ABN8NNC8_9CNID|nr:unnamed protein product [Porites lobata]
MKILCPMLAHCLLFSLVLFISLKDVEALIPMSGGGVNGKVRKTQALDNHYRRSICQAARSLNCKDDSESEPGMRPFKSF